MAGSPGKIFHDIPIDLSGPRERQDPAVQEMRARLMKAFEDATKSQARGTDGALDRTAVASGADSIHKIAVATGNFGATRA
jgi:NitT/TauT family transport system ATP-binding protein